MARTRANISFLFFSLLPRPFFTLRLFRENMRRIILNYWSSKARCSRRKWEGISERVLGNVWFRIERTESDQVFRGSRKGWMGEGGGHGSLSRSFREGSRYKVSGKDSGPRTQWFVNFWPMRCVLGRDEETFQIERVILISLWTVQLAQTTGLSDFQFRNREISSFEDRFAR